MAWRWRCLLHFQDGSGMAAWGKAQLDTRLTHAFHMRPGTVAEEQTLVLQEGEVLRADIFWPDDREDLAIDTRDTFAVASVLDWLLPDLEADERVSWMDYHHCQHDVSGPCPSPTWRWPDIAPEPGTLEPWQAWDGHPDSLYQIGDEVSHNGRHWKATVGDNHWEPGEYGWEDLGPLP